MKRYNLYFLFLLFSFYACKSKDDQQNISENNIDAARNFIRAALDGKFQDARTYMLIDSVNTNFMDVAERSFKNTDQATKNGYRTSSINIINVSEPVKDSVMVVIYANTFKNDHDTLKVVKQNGKWLVDLKYLYLHDVDTTLPATLKIDSLND